MTELKQFPIPEIIEILDKTKSDLRTTFNAVNIGIIESFDATDQTASVRIAIKQIQSIAPDGTRFYAEKPVLLKCPVIFPCGGGFVLTFPIAAGDEYLVLFNDREIDNWFANGGVQAPNTLRSHDLSDGLVLVGLRSTPRKLTNVSTSATQLRSDGGGTLIEVGGGVVKVVAPTKIRFETPLLEVTGDITARAGTSNIPLATHVHTGVQSGISNTGLPIP